jgi:phosphotransferase system HPr (HPr) family protein
MQKTLLTIQNDVGLHARPAAEFVKLAANYQSSITIRNVNNNSAAVDAKSILSVLTLGVEKGHRIELTCDGQDEMQAILAIRELIESDFDGKF